MQTNYTVEEFHELQQLAYDNASAMVKRFGKELNDGVASTYEQWRLVYCKLQYAQSLLESYMLAGMKAQDLKTDRRNN